MLRMTITPYENSYLLPIPAGYIGKTVEILLYSTTENIENNQAFTGKKPSDFFCTLSVVEGEKFQDYVSNSRLEWNRNI